MKAKTLEDAPPAEETASTGIEATVSSLKAGVEKATAGLEATQLQVRQQVKQGVEKAMTTAEEFVSFNQGNVEAFVKSGQIWSTGMQDLSKQIAATAQSSLDEGVATFKALTGAKTLKDAFDLQAAYVRSALEKTLESGFAHIPVAIHPAEQEIHYAVEQLDEAAGELAAIAQRAVEAAQKRGDEIDAMLADIRRFRAA